MPYLLENKERKGEDWFNFEQVVNTARYLLMCGKMDYKSLYDVEDKNDLKYIEMYSNDDLKKAWDKAEQQRKKTLDFIISSAKMISMGNGSFNDFINDINSSLHESDFISDKEVNDIWNKYSKK